MSRAKDSALRNRGAKPRDPEERVRRVGAAVSSLEKIGAAFTIAEVAERAGISRATIYRSPELRALIGAKGDGVRVVEAEIHAKVCARHEASKAKARALRQQLADTERSWTEIRERALAAERLLADAERRIKQMETQQSLSNAVSPLAGVAARLTPEELRQARRQLARALHPDLFTHDSAALLLATELLKSINMLAG